MTPVRERSLSRGTTADLGDVQSPSGGGAGIAVEELGLRYGELAVLEDVSLQIPGGSFCTLLGPSGSGKTTLLRAIAGLATPSSGRIAIGGRDVTRMSVQARNIGFVFQNYALFPHMSVAENIEYPLKLRKMPAVERRARVGEILALIELPKTGDRAVGQLSGGQQQRVAIGRALAYRPTLLLLDEPMGALDRRLRQQLGSELREIQQRTGITAVYVTHDQEEAFILSDKVAVMNHGRILQYATPAELYFQPKSRFVAGFLGEANIIPVSDLAQDGAGALTAATSYGRIPVVDRRDGASPGDLSVVIRPEHIILADHDRAEPDSATPVPVEVVRELFLGSRVLVTVRAADKSELLIESAKATPWVAGARHWVSWRNAAAVLVSH